jgi:hypothetical protein
MGPVAVKDETLDVEHRIGPPERFNFWWHECIDLGIKKGRGRVLNSHAPSLFKGTVAPD